MKNISFLYQLKSKINHLIPSNELENVHESLSPNEINNFRISCYRELNKIDNWEDQYFSIASTNLTNLLGPDLSIQSKLNLSIQMPNDDSSILDLHTDALSGQSVFELVLWVL